ncbi:hypothetical protein ACIPSE_03095 [Streptomyces sp. NPDC090106]|uniref:hypothetical protein n=1 Tax=Streptomyces sp. NPDC090106 TaxID=3365946 RepID=UPI003824270E
MGEGLNGGGASGRRRARGTVSGVEALLADAMREDRPGDRGGDLGEREAVAAFRTARDTGAHRARTRRRDDWRPAGERRRPFAVRTTLSVAVAGLALGGVAFAAIGASSGGSAPRAARETSSATARPGTTAPATPATPAPADSGRPVTAQDTEAHCRSYEKLQGRGKALDSAVWQRLAEAAGGAENVAAYCAGRLAADDEGVKADRTTGAAASAKARQSAKAENSASGNADGGADGNGNGNGKKKQ